MKAVQQAMLKAEPGPSVLEQVGVWRGRMKVWEPGGTGAQGLTLPGGNMIPHAGSRHRGEKGHLQGRYIDRECDGGLT